MNVGAQRLLHISRPVADPRTIRILGPLGGFRPGRTTTQGDILGRLFAADGHVVHSASALRSRIPALAHILLAAARGEPTDILFVQTYSGRSFAAAVVASLVARIRRRPLILHLHGGALPELFARNHRLAKFALEGATAIVAPSPYLAEATRRLGHDARVIANVLELGHYPYRERCALRPRLLWMRSFHPLYNPALALRVLGRVRASRPDATLVMAGLDKGLMAAMQREADRLGIGPAVRFPGFLNAEGKIREGADADIFLNTNRVDNAPVAVLEAGALGLPVVATRVAGIDSLLEDGRTALLVPDDDDEAMAAAVLRLLDDPHLARRLSRAGRELAEASSWSRVRRQWYALFHEVERRT